MGGEEEGRVNEGEKVGRKKEFGPPIFTTDRRHNPLIVMYIESNISFSSTDKWTLMPLPISYRVGRIKRRHFTLITGIEQRSFKQQKTM